MEWRAVPGVQGIKVSSDGMVKTLFKGPRFPKVCGHGYPIVRINGKTLKVHRLIALAFVGPQPSSSHTVDHINHDRADNRACNLRWATKQEQRANQCKIDLSTHKSNNATEYRRIGDVEWKVAHSQQEVCRTIGCCSSEVSMCVRGLRNTARGYEFRRAPVEEIDGEEWAENDGFAVSNMGRIRHKTAPPFKPTVARNMEYAMFRHEPVHVTVAMAFVPGWFAGATVDHINQDKADNRAANLRWASLQEQRANQARSSQEGSNRKRKAPPTHSRRVGAWIRGKWFEFESALEAQYELQIMAQNIGKCASGQRATAGGFEWHYL